MNANPLAQTAHLIEPAVEMATVYGEFLQEFIDAGEDGVLFTVPAEIGDPAESIRRMQDHAQGLSLPEGWVPSSAYWLVSGEGRLVGEIHIRHRLTPDLEIFGGHIGYMVRPSERSKGHASRMLAMALDKARALGLRRVKVTCDSDNDASIRVAVKNGGQFESGVAAATLSVKPPHRLVFHYWIPL